MLSTRSPGSAALARAGSAPGLVFCSPLPAVPSSALELEGVGAWLKDAALDWRQLASMVAFADENYLRQRLRIEAGWEIVLCCWLPGQGSAVHGHGESMGVVRVLEGTLEETRYLRAGRSLQPAAEAAFHAGAVLLEGREVVHRMRNDGDAAAVSLHLYSPPLEATALAALP